jgi:signal peptidase I
MAQRRNRRATTSDEAAEKTATADTTNKDAKPHRGGNRDLVESLVVALILAFLFKTYVAEAFVIPTGSMAPTLRGLHVEARNDQGLIVPVGAVRRSETQIAPTLAVTLPLYGRTLPMQQSAGEDGAGVTPYFYEGDRILVSKNAYLFSDPERYDVVVFKCPDEAERNYIKRMVGRPNETVRIYRGDILSRPHGEEKFTLARKEPHHVQATAQLVFDSQYVDPTLRAMGYLRFVPGPTDSPHWNTEDEGRSYTLDAPDARVSWLRYQHMLPTWDEWQVIDSGGTPAQPRPRLITDFCAYNTAQVYEPDFPPAPEQLGAHWVSDLVADATVEIESIRGNEPALVLQLIKGGRTIEARIPVGKGNIELDLNDGSEPRTAPSPVTGPGTYRLGFANVDHQALLWINGYLVSFDQPTTYSAWKDLVPTEADLNPARFGGRGIVAKWSDLRVSRDIYYIDNRRDRNEYYSNGSRRVPRTTDFIGYPFGDPSDPQNFGFNARRTIERQARNWADFYASPDRWDAFRDENMSHRDFELGEGQFLMLGDNSPSSSDSRAWSRYQVDRRLLIGKALYIYWPHGWETPWHVTIPGGPGSTSPIPIVGGWRFPFYPDFSRMGRIH